MKFRSIALLLALAIFSATLRRSEAQPADSPAPQRPNIIFILMDDMRWDSLGCMNHPFVKTPNLDRIAHEAALFKNFFVTLPLCSPSRATFLTGQYAHTTGVTTNGDNNARSHELVTFARLMQPAGYETAYIGKIHMGNDATPRPGWDRSVIFKGQGRYQDCPLNIDGKEEKISGYITDVLSDYAVDFVKKHHEKPFVLCLAHKAVHGPFEPAERHQNLYENDSLPHTPNLDDDLKGKPVLTRKVGNSPAGHPDQGPGDKQIKNQLRCISAADEGVGRIFKALEETNQLDNTMIVFTSDNGYFFGEHNLGDKRAAYEESIRDPLLVRYPKLVKPGTTIDQMVLNVDIAPTFLELAGVPAPKNMHGRSILPLLKGDTSNSRTAALFEYFQEKPYPRVPTWQAVRSAGWKYIHYTELENMDELYNVAADPYEMKNLIADASAADQLKQLKAQLQKEIDATK